MGLPFFAQYQQSDFEQAVVYSLSGVFTEVKATAMKSPYIDKRHTLVWIVNIALIILVVIISIAGYQAYHRLNNMVTQLEKNAEPNYNLLLIKELSFFINEMERETELYVNDPRISHLRDFNEAFEQSQQLIDSLRSHYSDKGLLALCDSLSFLVKERAKIQTRQSAIGNDLLETTIEDLSKKIEELPATIQDTTTQEPVKKPGLFKRIFTSKKKREQQKDTVQRPSQVELLQKEIMAELEDTRVSAERQGQQLKAQLSTLEARSQELQAQIIDVINGLEGAELGNDRENVRNIQALTRDTNGQIVLFSALSGTLLIITIISQLNYLIRNKNHQRALHEARLKAEELTRAKEQFLANMSHEVRTPMNAISGFTNQLMKTDLKKEQLEQVQIIKNSSSHLLRILNDVLDFSKLQANKVSLEYESMDLKEVLNESTRLFEEMANEKGLKLITELGPMPDRLRGDAHRLKQIILNLLSNAIKFTDSGYVKLTTEKPRSEHGLEWIKISVEDSGVGISKADQKRIFEEFEQANVSDNSKGTGLGLAISSMLVKLYNGNIRVKSEKGKGTRMILNLPFRPDDSSESPKTVSKPRIELNELNILIADDEPFNLKLLQAIFKDHAISIAEFGNGKQAYEALRSESFDIALLDLKMPGMNGWEIASEIRNQPGPNQNTPLIALTATVSETERKKSVKAGFNRILRKPFEEKELLQLIKRSTKKKEKVQTQEPVTERREVKIDLSQLQKMGDEAFVKEMLQIFIQSSAKSINALKQAITAKDRDSIKHEAHKMLPPARHLKITAIVEVLGEIHDQAESAPIADLKRQVIEVAEMLEIIQREPLTL